MSILRSRCCGHNFHTCLEYADDAHNVPLMNDEVHLNELGSIVVARRLVERGELRQPGAYVTRSPLLSRDVVQEANLRAGLIQFNIPFR
jgi:hypothetical protein